MRSALAAIAVLLCVGCASFAQLAAASYDPLASGTTALTLDKAFAAYLKANGLSLSATAPAKRRGAKLTLPVAGGEMDPSTGKGTIDHGGALVFAGKRGKVLLRAIVVKAKRAPLYAKVGGGQLKVATATKAITARDGFGTKFTATKLALTEKVATRLNKKLRPEIPFEAGQSIGALVAKSQPASVAVLPTDRAYLTPTPQILAKFEQLHVSLNPIAPAELSSGPLFSFPIGEEGQIAPDGSSGTLHIGGALEFLQLGAGQVFWAEQWLDLGAKSDSAEVNLQPSPPFGGKQGRVAVLDLGAGAVSSDPRARTVAVTGAPLALSASTAAAFNQAFAQGKAVFAAGEQFGSVSFVAQGQ